MAGQIGSRLIEREQERFVKIAAHGQHRVQGRPGVPLGEHKTIPVRPAGFFRTHAHFLVIQVYQGIDDGQRAAHMPNANRSDHPDDQTPGLLAQFGQLPQLFFSHDSASFSLLKYFTVKKLCRLQEQPAVAPVSQMLPRGFQYGLPQIRMRVQSAALARHQFKRQVHELVHNLRHDHPCFAAHGRMHGMLTEKAAIQAVVSVGGHGTNGVAGIDIFQIIRNTSG